MISRAVAIVLSANLVLCNNCYWNDGSSYQLFSSKTPYDTVRGDIRDYPVPENCSAVTVWLLNRHGNRNPGDDDTDAMKVIAGLKDEIVDSFNAGKSKLCAQDVDDFKRWKWNETMEVSQSYLTGTGYEELYNIGRRIKERYPHLLKGSQDDFYFRTTNEQRTVTSSMAFVHGLTENSNLSLVVDGPWPRDDVIRPYENCDRYQKEVKYSQESSDQLDAYYKSPEYVAVQNNVQNRLGIPTQLSADDIYTFYDLCRYYRSWDPQLRSPWCSVFTKEDLVVLEYKDDVRHYYRNGYGSWISVSLGGPAVKDLYESMEASIQGNGKNLIAYFSHDTMIEMTACAMGLFKDNELFGATRNPERLWRSSVVGAFAANIMAVLNRCETSGQQSYKVQLFLNEKPIDLCPLEGCEWKDFREKFQSFSTANLDFCI
ncbi:unnamed protein product [Chilo suppressalis]|uniref:Multiple inositol polyphosphate phosphatase 1 n=1 Tax=Chilo suppressalis TaxID=168631 RepID=A0ABN8AYI2_CHISP|nr:unnamed protein product [Chilo suppressalis]